MKLSIQILALLGVLAVVAEGRRCRPVGAGLRLFDRKCIRQTEWEVVHDDEEHRVTCRCLGLTVKQCVRCVYVQDPTTSPPDDLTTTDVPPVETDPPADSSTEAPIETDPPADSSTEAPIETDPPADSSTGAPIETEPTGVFSTAAPIETEPTPSFTTGAPIETEPPAVSTTGFNR